jgi:hypothetical protein
MAWRVLGRLASTEPSYVGDAGFVSEGWPLASLLLFYSSGFLAPFDACGDDIKP